MIAFAWLVLGLVVLVAGAEITVRGASRLAALLGISPLVIGLTIVAFGTSSPELAVGIRAALAGQPDLVIGNAVGSNIFNVLFILGVSALIVPLAVSIQLIRIDVPFMLAAAVLAFAAAYNGRLERWEGAAGVALLIAYTLFTMRAGKAAGEPADAESPAGEKSWMAGLRCTGLILAGLAMLTLGSGWLVDGATTLARLAGISELVIGLTIVAIGTSLPEVATSIMASIRGERDIAVGNVVGSNTFNMLGVLGVSAVFAPAGVIVPESALSFDMPVMLGVSLLCLPIFVTGAVISRFEGSLFLFYYVAYTAILLISATGSTWLPPLPVLAGYLLFPAVIVIFTDSLLSSGKSIRTLEKEIWDGVEEPLRVVARQTRRIVIIITGFTVLLVGIALIVLPGPAALVIPFGLFLLGSEFVWAKRLLEKLHANLNAAAHRVKDWARPE